MKKKIAIVTRQMVMGGIEKSLIAMLEVMDPNKYDVTLLVMAKGGELFKDIPSWVTVVCIYGEEKTTIEKVVSYFKKGQIKNGIKRIYYTILSKSTKSIFKQELLHSKMIPIEDREYDIAIAYHVPSSFPVIYTLNNIKANNRIAWIHSDVSKYKEYMKLYDNYYHKFDKILCVSKDGANKFINMYPSLKSRTQVFYNIINKDSIIQMSEESNGFDDDFKGIRILTVGRLTEEKGHELIPNIVIKLKQKFVNIRWYCIGDGETRKKLELDIIKNGLQNDVILLGTKKNPYPFIKQSDIYVQPSKHEGYCITLTEARIFNKPIVTTDFVGAREQIVNEKTGLIVKFDENEIVEGINKLIKDKQLRLNLIDNLKNENQNNNVNRGDFFDFI